MNPITFYDFFVVCICYIPAFISVRPVQFWEQKRHLIGSGVSSYSFKILLYASFIIIIHILILNKMQRSFFKYLHVHLYNKTYTYYDVSFTFSRTRYPPCINSQVLGLFKLKQFLRKKLNWGRTFKSCLFISHFIIVCSNNTYGLECAESCGSCNDGKPCNNINGTCHLGCNEGVEGNLCQKGEWSF